MSPFDLLQEAARILDEKKAHNQRAIRITEQTIIADYFLIVTGNSTTHIKSLADELEHQLKEQHGIVPKASEGRTTGWILLDYGTVLVHVFLKDQREFYNLERLWEDGETVQLAIGEQPPEA
ncbi:MAG: ribosome silencing factor [Oscillospiraceae bacterium]|jgi:ribosome-associated protein|nr:ribosome silencing factor [Oscillospiraceae bacterium]